MQLINSDVYIRPGAITTIKLINIPVISNKKNSFRRPLIGTPTSSLSFHRKRERKEILIIAVRMQFVFIFLMQVSTNAKSDII